MIRPRTVERVPSAERIAQILLPWDNAEVFQSNLDGYSGGRLASWTVWMAPTTMHPAEVAKRVGMSEAELRSVNAIPPRMVVRAGSSLLVPRSSRMMLDVSEKVADNGQMSLGPEIVFKRTLVRARKGDTVGSVARRYKVSADQLAQWNKTSVSSRFKSGQQVVVMIAVRATGSTPVGVHAKVSVPQKMAVQKAGARKTAPAKTTVRTATTAKPSRRSAAAHKPVAHHTPAPHKARTTRVAKH